MTLHDCNAVRMLSNHLISLSVHCTMESITSLALYQLLGSASLLYRLNLMTASLLCLFILPWPSVSVICEELISLSLGGNASHSLSLQW